MDDLEKTLGQVLSDPAAMAEVTRLAQQLMGDAPSLPEGSPAAGALPGALPGVLGQLGGKSHPLARAMAPYLGEERRARLERALGVASAARMAEAALRGMGGIHGLSSI